MPNWLQTWYDISFFAYLFYIIFLQSREKEGTLYAGQVIFALAFLPVTLIIACIALIIYGVRWFSKLCKTEVWRKK